MSKTKHKYHTEDEFDDGVRDGRKPGKNRHREKRLDRALRTKNIDQLIELDDEGLDPIDIEDEIWEDDILPMDYDKYIK